MTKKNEALDVYCDSCNERAGQLPENNAGEGRWFLCATIGCEKEDQELFPSQAFHDREDREQEEADNAYIEYLMSQETTIVDPVTGLRYLVMDSMD